jgi:hypothetical protein
MNPNMVMTSMEAQKPIVMKKLNQRKARMEDYDDEEAGMTMVSGDPSAIRITKAWFSVRTAKLLTGACILYVVFLGLVGIIQICYDANQYAFSTLVYSILYGVGVGVGLFVFLVNMNSYNGGDQDLFTFEVMVSWLLVSIMYLVAMLKSIRIETASSPINTLDKAININVAATFAIGALGLQLVLMLAVLFMRDK